MKKGVLFLVALLLVSFVSAEEAAAPVDDIKPDVTILEPFDGDILSGQVVVRVLATDNVGIEKVEFVLDGVVVYTSVVPLEDGTYLWNLDTLTVDDGLHALTVAPYDAAGNFNDLSTIQFAVDNSGAAQYGDAPADIYSDIPASPELPGNLQRGTLQQISEPVVQQNLKQIPRVPENAQESPAEERAPAAEGKKPLWMTLLMSFGIVAVVSAALVVGMQKLRAPADVPEHIKMYVYANMQQGYPTTSIRSALLQQGWDDNVIDEAFKDAIGRNDSEIPF